MAYGFEIYDASGNLIINLSKRVPRFLGTFTTGTTASSMTDARLSSGLPWFHVLYTTGSYSPSFTINATGFSWSWNSFVTSRSLQGSSVVAYGFY